MNSKLYCLEWQGLICPLLHRSALTPNRQTLCLEVNQVNAPCKKVWNQLNQPPTSTLKPPQGYPTKNRDIMLLPPFGFRKKITLKRKFLYIPMCCWRQCLCGGQGNRPTKRKAAGVMQHANENEKAKTPRPKFLIINILATGKQQMMKLREIAIHKAWDHIAEFSRNGCCTNYNCHARPNISQIVLFSSKCVKLHISSYHIMQTAPTSDVAWSSII